MFLLPPWHNLVLRKPGNPRAPREGVQERALDSLFPHGFPGSNPGGGVFFIKVNGGISMEIRQFKESDAEELSSVIRATLMNVNIKDSPKFAIEEQHGEYAPDELIALSNEREIFVAIQDDDIVGSVAKEGNHISTLFVKHELRKQGIGKLLLKFIENKIKDEGFKTADLTSGPTALTWYEKMGYSETEKQFDRGELTGIHMSKNL